MLIYLYNELLDPYIFWFLFLLLPLMISYGSAKEDEALHKKFPELIHLDNLHKTESYLSKINELKIRELFFSIIDIIVPAIKPSVVSLS